MENRSEIKPQEKGKVKHNRKVEITVNVTFASGHFETKKKITITEKKQI